MASVGFIGLGAMGLPMAKRLCLAGHTVKVAVHKNETPVQEIKKLGGRVAEGFAEVAKDVDVLISIVPDDAQLEKLLLNSPTSDNIPPGALLLEMTTATPAVMRRIAESLEKKDVFVLDAPVSGGVASAEKGTLTIMCGGSKAAYEMATPYLKVLGDKTHLVGGVGSGKALKAVNQLLVGINTAAIAEALALAVHMGIDLEVMREVVSSSSGYSAAFANKFPSMVKGDYTPRFTSKLLRKDLGIALAEGSATALPLAALASRLYGMMPPEADDLDYSAIAELYKQKRIAVNLDAPPLETTPR